MLNRIVIFWLFCRSLNFKFPGGNGIVSLPGLIMTKTCTAIHILGMSIHACAVQSGHEVFNRTILQR